MKPRIFILYTGGTIGMKHTVDGLAPDTALVEQAFADDVDAELHWHICQPLIDSSAVSLSNWQEWLAIIADVANKYDAILVLHGTDTLAYTANILALGLPDLNIPIILTGAQWPFTAPNSDAPENLALALAAAQQGKSGVWLAFNGNIIPAIGSSKVSTEVAAGFANQHFGCETLADWQADKKNVSHKIDNTAATKVWQVCPDAKIVCLPFIPGYSAAFIADVLMQNSADAYILQTFGHGNAPTSKHLLDALAYVSNSGKLVMNISQVPQGRVEAVYAQGHALRNAGVMNGGIANLETATALLTLAVSNQWRVEDIRACLEKYGLAK